jgi:hypothetical protein
MQAQIIIDGRIAGVIDTYELGVKTPACKTLQWNSGPWPDGDHTIQVKALNVSNTSLSGGVLDMRGFVYVIG